MQVCREVKKCEEFKRDSQNRGLHHIPMLERLANACSWICTSCTILIMLLQLPSGCHQNWDYLRTWTKTARWFHMYITHGRYSSFAFFASQERFAKIKTANFSLPRHVCGERIAHSIRHFNIKLSSRPNSNRRTFQWVCLWQLFVRPIGKSKCYVSTNERYRRRQRAETTASTSGQGTRLPYT